MCYPFRPRLEQFEDRLLPNNLLTDLDLRLGPPGAGPQALVSTINLAEAARVETTRVDIEDPQQAVSAHGDTLASPVPGLVNGVEAVPGELAPSDWIVRFTSFQPVSYVIEIAYHVSASPPSEGHTSTGHYSSSEGATTTILYLSQGTVTYTGLPGINLEDAASPLKVDLAPFHLDNGTGSVDVTSLSANCPEFSVGAATWTIGPATLNLNNTSDVGIVRVTLQHKKGPADGLTQLTIRLSGVTFSQTENGEWHATVLPNAMGGGGIGYDRLPGNPDFV